MAQTSKHRELPLTNRVFIPLMVISGLLAVFVTLILAAAAAGTIYLLVRAALQHPYTAGTITLASLVFIFILEHQPKRFRSTSTPTPPKTTLQAEPVIQESTQPTTLWHGWKDQQAPADTPNQEDTPSSPANLPDEPS